jgi:hypothetical protein
VDPRKRFTADEALASLWIEEDATTLACHDLGASLSQLKQFNALQKLLGAVKTVMATNRFNKLNSLGVGFEKDLKELVEEEGAQCLLATFAN